MKGRRFSVALGASVASGALMFAGAPAYAQEAPSTQDSTVDDIVVTAQKRAQNVQDVPIAVTAFSGEAIRDRGVTQISQLANFSPSVQLTNAAYTFSSPAMLSAYIRGIGQDDFAANFEPGVGTYVDGVYLARTIGANANLLDVARIEILKGPQGTLFGRNTIGGAISVVTRDPGNDFAIQGEVTAGRFNRMDVRGVVDIPLSDKLRSSISFSSENRSGFQKRIPFPGSGNAVTDLPTAFPETAYIYHDDAGGNHSNSVRGKLLWEPQDGLRVTMIGDYTHESQGAGPISIIKTADNGPSGVAGFTFAGLYNLCISTPPASLGGFGPMCGPRATVGTALAGVNVDADPGNDRMVYGNQFLTGNPDTTYATGVNFSKLTSYGVTGIVEAELSDNVTLKSISAYRNLDSNIGADLDGSPLTIFQVSLRLKQEQLSQEFQLTGKSFGNRLNWLVGAYYFHESMDEVQPLMLSAGLLQVDQFNKFTTNSVAVFTHLNYEISDQLSVTLGGRYTHEDKKFSGIFNDRNALTTKLGVPSFLFPVPSDTTMLYVPGINKLKFDDFSPRIGIEFKPSRDIMLYASYSKGFKSGGWTSRVSFPVLVAPSFKEEKAESYEIGVKSELFDRRLRLNIAAFQTNYKGMQLNILRGISPTFENAGRARIRGLEVESQLVLSEAFRLNASFGYLDAKYLSVDDPSGVITVNSSLPKVPKWTVYIGPEIRLAGPADSQIALRADYSYRSKAMNNSENSEIVAARAVSLVNVSATFTPKSKAWSLTAGATNLFNTRYIVNGVDQSGGVGMTIATYNRPAEWYTTLRFNF